MDEDIAKLYQISGYFRRCQSKTNCKKAQNR